MYFLKIGNFKSVCGPIARCVDDCAIFIRMMLDQRNFVENGDIYFKPHKFDNAMFEDRSKKRIAYYKSIE